MVSLADVTGGSLSLQAPDGSHDIATLTLTVSSSEGGNDHLASQPLTVTATATAEAPTFGGASTFSGNEETRQPITLSGITVSSVDSDDTLGAAHDHGRSLGLDADRQRHRHHEWHRGFARRRHRRQSLAAGAG